MYKDQVKQKKTLAVASNQSIITRFVAKQITKHVREVKIINDTVNKKNDLVKGKW